MKRPAGENNEFFMRYITASREDEKLGMICTDAGFTRVKPYAVYPPNIDAHPAAFRKIAEGRILPEFQIAYIAGGEGIFEAEGSTYKVVPGSVLIMFPGRRHRAKPVFETGWDEYWVGFNGPFFTGMIEEGILSRDRVFFEMGPHNQILSIYDEIYEEVTTQRPLYQLKACSAILSLIAEILSRSRRMLQPDYYEAIVEKAKYFMGLNISGVINMSHIAEQIGISPSRLNTIFKTYTSMTPYQYYINIKIHKAQSLLEENVSVKETAYRMGFDDQYHFSRLFKRKTGIAPSRWKEYLRP
ncbi:MAG: AraC family transcriptional regulator [Treponema sp.]|jgi:AraC-like DNA-binding protein|nr:AraC family transcriptional regulator [Treponema sp.]